MIINGVNSKANWHNINITKEYVQLNEPSSNKSFINSFVVSSSHFIYKFIFISLIESKIIEYIIKYIKKAKHYNTTNTHIG